MIYFTSDLHFGHKNIIEYCNRPFENVEEMDNEIIKIWNKKARPNDIIYILGDFSWYNAEKTNKILEKLNGRKILIIGNHDYKFLKNSNFNKNLFEEIKQYEELIINKKRIILFHYPIIDWNCKYYNSIHLFGHIHNTENEDTKYMKKQKNCYNVGFDIWKNLVSIEEIGVKL